VSVAAAGMEDRHSRAAGAAASCRKGFPMSSVGDRIRQSRVGCHNARTLLLGRAFPDRQAALWYSLINPLTAVWRLIRAVMSMASLGSCTGG
jgi:hypothetical protein